MSTTPKPTAVTAPDLLARLIACAPRSPFARSFLEYVDPDDRLGCLSTLLGPEPVPLVAVAARRPVFDDAQILPGEGLFLLYDGVVEEWQSQFRLSVRHPGDLLGELPALAERRSSQVGATGGQPNAAVARDACRLLPLPGAALRVAMDTHPGLVRAVLQAVAEHAHELADDEGQVVEALDEFFPRGFGQLTPGPYDCRDVTIHLFPFVMPEAPDHPMQVSRPPGVSWLSPFFFVALVKMRDTAHPAFAQTFHYDEVAFFVPSTVRGLETPSLHIPFIYADNIMAILLGRELAGMPKLQVSTFIEPLDAPLDAPADDIREPWRLLARRTDRIELELRFRQTDTNAPVNPSVSPKSLWDRLMGGPSLGLETAAALWSQLIDLLDAPPAGALALPLWMGFDTVRTTAWQRIFHPETRYTSPSGARMAAGPGDFRLDALVETRFKVGQIFAITPLTPEPGPDACYVADSFPLHGCQPLSPRGLRLHLKMQMIGGPVLLDYLDDPRWARDPARSWGPWVRLLPPGVTGRT